MTVSFDDWKKLDLRVGKIKEAKRIPHTEKLYALQVDVGKPIQIVSGLVPYYSAEELIGKSIIVLVNLEPAVFAGETSEGMVLCAEDDEKCVLLTPEKPMPPGAVVV